MTYSAIIAGKAIQNGTLLIYVDYTDGTNSWRESIACVSSMPSNWISNTVKSRLAQLNALSSFSDSIPISSAISDPTLPSPSLADQTLTQFNTDLATLQRKMNFVNLGLLSASDPSILALQSSLSKTLPSISI